MRTGSARRAYYQALHANERIRLLNRSQDIAGGIYSVAERRFKAGDIAILDRETGGLVTSTLFTSLVLPTFYLALIRIFNAKDA